MYQIDHGCQVSISMPEIELEEVGLIGIDLPKKESKHSKLKE